MATRRQASGARGVIYLGNMQYRMSPLTDRDTAELDLFVQALAVRQTRRNILPEATPAERDEIMAVAITHARTFTWTQGEGAELMATPEGAARLMWQGLYRSHPALTVEQVQEFLSDPDTLEETHRAFDQINTVPTTTAPVRKPASNQKEHPTPDAGKIYRALSARYGWTPGEIADLTPAQQIMYLSGDSAPVDGIDPTTGRAFIQFNTRREYEAWLATRKQPST